MRRARIARAAASLALLFATPTIAATSGRDSNSHRHPFTFSTMMCVGNGCPERTYAYHRCSNGFIWSARTHKCVRRVSIDEKGQRQHAP
jgi:hypothetical protein